MFILSERILLLFLTRESFVFSEEDGCNVRVFTLCRFLAKCVIPSLILVRYIKEMVQDVEVEMFLGIVLTGSKILNSGTRPLAIFVKKWITLQPKLKN